MKDNREIMEQSLTVTKYHLDHIPEKYGKRYRTDEPETVSERLVPVAKIQKVDKTVDKRSGLLPTPIDFYLPDTLPVWTQPRKIATGHWTRRVIQDNILFSPLFNPYVHPSMISFRV